MTDIDVSLLDVGFRAVYAREGWIPLAAGEDGTILVGASRDLNPTQEEAIADDLGAPIEVVPVSQQFIIDAVIEVFAAEFAAEAADGLANANPVRSARTVLSRGQVIGFAVVASVAVLGALLLTGATLVIILAAINLFFLASVLFKFVVAFRGSRYDLVNKVSRFELAMLDEDELPFYTVLVPVFREEKVVAQLMTNLGAWTIRVTASRC